MLQLHRVLHLPGGSAQCTGRFNCVQMLHLLCVLQFRGCVNLVLLFRFATQGCAGPRRLIALACGLAG